MPVKVKKKDTGKLSVRVVVCHDWSQVKSSMRVPKILRSRAFVVFPHYPDIKDKVLLAMNYGKRVFVIEISCEDLDKYFEVLGEKTSTPLVKRMVCDYFDVKAHVLEHLKQLNRHKVQLPTGKE